MTVAVGSQLQTSPPYFGEWDSTPTAFSFQWQDSLDGVNLNGDIVGETRSDVIPDIAEEGRWLRVAVVASNAGGDSAQAFSEWVGPVEAAPPPPVPVVLLNPVVTGTLVVGDLLSCSTGTWSNTPTSYAYQWQSSPDGLSGWADVVGETSPTYTIAVGAGMYLLCVVTASNDGGPSDPAQSNAVGPSEAVPVGVPVNVSAPAVSGTSRVGSVLSASTGGWTHDPTSYIYQWQSSEDGIVWTDVPGETDADIILTPADEGLFFRVGVVAENGDGPSEVAYSDAVGPVSPAPSPSEDPMAPCTQWITGDDVADCCNIEASSGVIFDAVAQQASDLLFSISGRLFAGECERTVRPSCDSCYCGYQVLSRGHVVGPWDYGYPLMLCSSCLLACEPSLVKLAGVPIREVSEVKINGDVLDPSEYRVYNDRYLQRLDSVRWPVSQNLGLPDTEDHTFSITYTYGADPPALGVAAAAQIACELKKACDSSLTCNLPTGVTRVTRQGVTIDKLAFTSWGFREGRWATGLSLVDAFLASVNPAGLQRRPVFWSPGRRQYAQDWG